MLSFAPGRVQSSALELYTSREPFLILRSGLGCRYCRGFISPPRPTRLQEGKGRGVVTAEVCRGGGSRGRRRGGGWGGFGGGGQGLGVLGGVQAPAVPPGPKRSPRGHQAAEGRRALEA